MTITPRMAVAPDGHNVFEDGYSPTPDERLRPLRALCVFCDAEIKYVSLATDPNVRVPVNLGTQLDGALVVVIPRTAHKKTQRPLTVRLALPGDPRDHLRCQAHWVTCEGTVSGWQDRKRAAGLTRLVAPEATRSTGGRAGLCARCRKLHAWHYGGPVACPVCDRCKLVDCQAKHPQNPPRRDVCADCSTLGRGLTGEPY